MAAGAVTALAGLLFVLNPETQFFPTVTPVIAWLLIRSLILAYASRETAGSVRTWTGLSAGMDFLLAVLLIAGLSISTLVVSLFGPTPRAGRELRLGPRGELRGQRRCCCSKSRVANASRR